MASNSNVAHAWANQVKEKLTGSNFYFRGPSLYSYSTEIARFVEGKPIFTTRTYSVSTSRHQSEARSATRHLFRFYVDCEMYELRQHFTFADCAPFIADTFKRKVLYLVDKAKTAKSISHYITQIQATASEAEQFRFRHCPTYEYGYGELGSPFLEIVEACLQEQHGINVPRRKQVEANFKAQQEEKRAKEQAKWEAIQAERAKELPELRARWKAGEKVHRYDLGPIMLRLKEGHIETSRGAVLLESEARQLWMLMQNGASIEGREIGAYVGKEYNKDFLVIGCHEIPMSEVLEMAEKLGLIPPAQTAEQAS